MHGQGLDADSVWLKVDKEEIRGQAPGESPLEISRNEELAGCMSDVGCALVFHTSVVRCWRAR